MTLKEVFIEPAGV